jgi:large subunit ribosomal protein L6
MSRVGKSPISIPSSVNADFEGNFFKVKGSLGELSYRVPEEIKIDHSDNQISLSIDDESKKSRSLWGTSQRIMSNMVLGVSKGFTVRLEIRGVGYRASVKGKDLVLNLGYSHDVIYPIPEGIQIKTEKPTSISVFGADKQFVSQVAAEIRSFRKPEPYKGKGVRYEGEYVRQKEGKKK